MPAHLQSSFRPPAAQALRLVGSLGTTALLLAFGTAVLWAGFASSWLAVVFALLAINLAAAIVNRLPLQRRQWSFVAIHGSIISFMLGLWISHHYGYEGEIFLAQGEVTSNLQLFEEEVVLAQTLENGQSGVEHVHVLQQFSVPTDSVLSGLVLQEQSEVQPAIEIIDVIPNGVIASSIVSAREGVGPGLDYEISSADQAVESWLLADHPDYRHTDLGPLDIEILNFRQQKDFDFRAQASLLEQGLEIESIGSTELLHIPLPADLGKVIDAGGGVRVTVTAFVERARVNDGILLDTPTAPLNPAAELVIESEGSRERHIVFSQFPEFGIHERSGEPLAGSIHLEYAHALSKPLLTLLCNPKGRLHTQVSDSEGRKAAVQLPQSNHTAIPGTPYTFKLTRFIPNASFETEVRAVADGAENGTKLIKLRVTAGHKQNEFWLSLGDSMLVPVLGVGRSLVFRRKLRELPFRIGLESLNVSYYPQSHQTSNISSNVMVATADDSSAARSLSISLNQPLDYMGFRFLQSRFERGEDGKPYITVLSVSYNPGLTLVYASFILLILGVGWHVLSDGSPSRRGKGKRQPNGGESVGHIEVVLSPQDLTGGGVAKSEPAPIQVAASSESPPSLKHPQSTR